MKKLVLLLGAFALIGCGEKKVTGDGSASGNLDATVKKFTKAFEDENWKVCASIMLPEALKEMGGADKFPEVMKASFQAMKEGGMEVVVSGYEATPSNSIVQYSNTQWGSIINTTIPVVLNGEEGVITGCEIAISRDKGETWFLVSGSTKQGQALVAENYPGLYERLPVQKGILKVGEEEIDITGSELASGTPTPSNESAEPSTDTPNSLSDADVERLLKEAVDGDSLEERDDLLYQNNESEPYSGWVKSMRDSGQVRALAQFKDGELDGVNTWWHENGQKKREASYEDGEEVSAKYWNSKGEEVETAEKAAE